MVLTVLYGNKHKYEKGQVISKFGSVTFDTVLTENHKYTCRVTHYPVETGTLVSDHIVREPEIVQLSGMVSDTPLNILASFNRSVDAFNQLVEIQARRLVIKLVTGIKVYENMAISVLDVPRNMKTGQTLTFNIEFQKINYVDTVQIQNNIGNVFEGVQNNTPRAIVAENDAIPFIQNDPAYSLKDQAESQVSVGVQSLASVPTAMIPQVLSTASVFKGLA